MALVVSVNGRRAFLGLLVPYLSTLTLRLFANDVFANPLTLPSAFVEPSWAGYAPQPLSIWSAVYLNPVDSAETQAPTSSFIRTDSGGPSPVYGYFVTDRFGYLIFSERDPAAPVMIDGGGGRYLVTPRFDLGRLCPPALVPFSGGFTIGGSIHP